MLVYVLMAVPLLLAVWRRLRRVKAVAGPVLNISTGQIQGSILPSTAGRPFHAFQGIPFARPPLGPRRFLRPEPAERWDGVRQCNSALQFTQINIFRAGSPREGREDGLVLNVYSPHLYPDQPLPVMVWIHGGGFVSGSGTRGLYGPEHFMDRDVVLVTLNYRLSVLGGLYLGEECPGNQGLRDQILGLQWVQENIKQFGGAPDRVTIFGESAGGMSVMNHILSPRSAGLFSAAIAMSGSPLSPFTGADKHPRHYAVRLAARLGCTARSDQEILQFLQRQQPEQLQSLGYMFEEFIRAPFPFKPIVDGGLVSDPVLPAEPLQLLQSGQYNKVPIIVGTNKDEGLLIKGFYGREEGGYATAWRDWDTVGPLAFFHRERDEVGEAEVEATRQYRDKHWSDGQKFGASGPGGEALVRMYGDLLFTAPADWLVKLVAGGPDPPPVYHYLYSHQGPVSLYDILVLPPWKLGLQLLGLPLGLNLFSPRSGVCHGDELFILFKAALLPVNTVRSRQDRRVQASLLDRWTEFAARHQPGPGWERFDPAAPRYLEIRSEGESMEYPADHQARMAEWRDIWDAVPPTMRHSASSTWQAMQH